MEVTAQCLLCPTEALPKAKWSYLLDDQVAESLSKLLEESGDDFMSFFSNADYCGPCQEFVLDIDFLMRSFSAMQTKVLECRSIISRCIKDNLSVWSTSVGHEIGICSSKALNNVYIKYITYFNFELVLQIPLPLQPRRISNQI